MGLIAIVIIGLFFIWLEKERKLNLVIPHKYPVEIRLLSGLILIIGVIGIYQVQEIRKEHYHFLFGVAPNFLSALILPFGLIAYGKKVNSLENNPFVIWTGFNLGYWVLYEVCLWIDGRNFDFFDMLATLVGAVISGGIAVKITSLTNK